VIMELFGSLLSAVLGGGATGLLGIVVQRWFDWKAKAQELEVVKENNRLAEVLGNQELQRTERTAEAQERIADADRAARIGVAEQDRQGIEAQAAATLQGESYKSDTTTFLTGKLKSKAGPWVVGAMAFVDMVRGLIRPVLTAYLVWTAECMRTDMQAILNRYGTQLPVATVQELLMQVTSTLLYLATVAVVWWFGTRPPSNPRKA